MDYVIVHFKSWNSQSHHTRLYFVYIGYLGTYCMVHLIMICMMLDGYIIHNTVCLWILTWHYLDTGDCFFYSFRYSVMLFEKNCVMLTNESV